MQTLTHLLKLSTLVGFGIVDRIIRRLLMQPDQSFLRLFFPQESSSISWYFDMARLICNSRAFILPRPVKF